MDNITAARLDILAAALRAIAEALPPDAARAALAALRGQVAELPSVRADVDAARAAELGPMVQALTSAGFEPASSESTKVAASWCRAVGAPVERPDRHR